MAKKQTFTYQDGDFVVYPTHGVGKINGTENQKIAGTDVTLLVIRFEQDRMTLRVPLEKAMTLGLRTLSSRKHMDDAITTLKSKARVKRAMWSRRAQEYEAKINSGDLIAIAEVVRDLFRNENQPEQSYSERQLYEAAMERMAREVATIEKTTEDEAIVKLEAILAKTTGGVRRQPGSDAA